MGKFENWRHIRAELGEKDEDGLDELAGNFGMSREELEMVIELTEEGIYARITHSETETEYAVDGGEIKCSEMLMEPQEVLIGTETVEVKDHYGSNPKLHDELRTWMDEPVADCNEMPYATIGSYERFRDQGDGKADIKKYNIYGFGNCKLAGTVRIAERYKKEVEDFGTCYRCMDLEGPWENPEGSSKPLETPFGVMEVLEVGAKLHCNMGGVITVMSSGQMPLSPLGNEGDGEDGEYVEIPEDYRDLGSFISYMGWHKITSPSSNQYKLREDARNAGRASIAFPEYYAMVDGRIVIATKANIGGMLEVSIGDYVNVEFQNDDGTKTTYECIIGDAKGADAPNDWGHNDGKSVVEIIYHDYDPPDGYDKNSNDPWGVGRVSKIIKTGDNYFDE